MKQLIRLFELALVVASFMYIAHVNRQLVAAEAKAAYAQGQLDIYTHWSEEDTAKGLRKW